MSKDVNNNALLKAALWYAEEKKWPVLPLHTIRNGVCTCKNKGECDKPGKHPQYIPGDFEHGARSATTDTEVIKRAWKRYPKANVGIATGKNSFDVLDVDQKGDGDGTLADLEVANGKLPDTPEQITGGGGRQIMFTPCGRLKNEVRFAPGLDVRTDGGLVVAPPSLHISGREYEWEASSRPDEVELSPAPEWLIREVEQANSNGDGKTRNPLDIEKVLAGLPEGERDEQLFKYACSLRHKGLHRQEAEDLVLARARGCRPPFSEPEALRKVESAWKYDSGAAMGEEQNLADFTPEDLFKAARDEQDGDARIYVRLYRGRFTYDHSSGKWYEYAGHNWKEDLLNESLAAFDGVTDLYAKEAERLSWASVTAAKAGREEEAKKAEAKRKVFLRKISCLQKTQWKQAVLQLAASGKGSLGIRGNEWDRDPWVIACPNGIVNLKDGSLRPGKPEDYIKTACPTEWKGLDEPAPAWESFQRTITNDEDLPDCKRRLYGSAMPGTVVERALSMFDGPNGQNGKSTELEAIHFVLGPLAGPIPSELLLKQSRSQSADAPSASIMSLRGKRLVWASETERGREFSAARVKWLCGGDTLCGRDPFGRRQVEFAPSHSVFLLTNNKPAVSASEGAFWERVVLIRFPFTFKDNPAGPYERKRDPHLLEKLKAEASGILAWLVRGCLEWQQQGLNPPESVLEQAKEYRKSEDQLARFIEDRCLIDPMKEVKAGILFKAYRCWCEESGEKAIGVRPFGQEMGAKFDSYRKTQGVFYIGIGIGDE